MVRGARSDHVRCCALDGTHLPHTLPTHAWLGVPGYNDAEAMGSGGRGRAIARAMERHTHCARCVCYVDLGSESWLTQLHGRASMDLRVHHKDSWLLSNSQQPGQTVTAVDSGRGNNALQRWCVVRMDDGRVVALFWIEPGTPQFEPWVRPPIAGGAGGGGGGGSGDSATEATRSGSSGAGSEDGNLAEYTLQYTPADVQQADYG
jgi:hypothetical protein